jgi:hypothetical protein
MTTKTCDFCGAVEHPETYFFFSTVKIADLKPRDACGPCIRTLEKSSMPAAPVSKPRTVSVCAQCGATYIVGRDLEWHRRNCPTGKGNEARPVVDSTQTIANQARQPETCTSWTCPTCRNVFDWEEGVRVCTHCDSCTCPEMPRRLRRIRDLSLLKRSVTGMTTGAGILEREAAFKRVVEALGAWSVK